MNYTFQLLQLLRKFLIAAVIVQIIELLLQIIIELVIPIGVPTKEAKAETETHSVIPEARIRKCAKQFKVV